MTDIPDCVDGARLCKVRIWPTPSGRLQMAHAQDCPVRPGEPITARDYARGRSWPPRGRIAR